jgi:hypothetical protein
MAWTSATKKRRRNDFGVGRFIVATSVNRALFFKPEQGVPSQGKKISKALLTNTSDVHPAASKNAAMSPSGSKAVSLKVSKYFPLYTKPQEG